MMNVLEAPVGAQIEVRERRENYAKFVIEPLDRGFGITLGNALRRILLSTIPGAAVTYVKIDSVLHEFSTIPGVVEDTVDLLLNLKGLPIKLNTEDPKVLSLSVSGAKEVTAGDIAPDADVEILQPNYHIATLSKKDAMLSMEIGVEKSRGYVTSDKQRNIEHMIGLIPMDSIFSPIRKVNFSVDDTRVGQSVDRNIHRALEPDHDNGAGRGHLGVDVLGELENQPGKTARGGERGLALDRIRMAYAARHRADQDQAGRKL